MVKNGCEITTKVHAITKKMGSSDDNGMQPDPKMAQDYSSLCLYFSKLNFLILKQFYVYANIYRH